MPSLGPSDPTRSLPAERVLPLARAAGAECGVTRLAEVTRLDRFGLPVWQAIRPLSRAVSVHQGKGANDTDARIGALMEAIESHAAENFDAEGPICRFDELPADRRARCFTDFAIYRHDPPAADRPRKWAEASELVSGNTLYLPFETVSLDFTRNTPSAFDRTSNGVAAGTSRDDASLAALHEFIERDAMIEWQRESMLDRMACTLDVETVPFEWLRLWRDRLRESGTAVRFYRVPTMTSTPLFACEINDLGKDGVHYRAGQGRGCHADPEIALFKALAEALQARLTVIAGARDDLFNDDYVVPANGFRIIFGLPLPSGYDGVDWQEVAPGPNKTEHLAEALARAGYPQVALVDLAETYGITVVRAFICGFGSLRRRRRPPLP